MKHHYSNLRLATLALVLTLMLGSCSFDDVDSVSTGTDSTIRFGTSITTKSSKNKSLKSSTYETFHAYKLKDHEMYLLAETADGLNFSVSPYGQTENGGTESMRLQSSPATIISGSDWASEHHGEKVRFCAYSYAAQDTYNDKSQSEYKLSDVIEAGVTISPYITDQDLTIPSETSEDGSIQLSTSQTYYWTTKNNRLTFIGIFPSATDLGEGKSYNISYDGEPKFTYTIEEEPENMKDFLVSQISYEGNGDDSKKVSFSMKHIMAGLSVGLSDGLSEKYQITGVTFENIYVTGTYNLASDSWDTSTFEAGTRTFDASDGNMPTSNNQCMFLVLPQKLKGERGAELRIKVKDLINDTETTYIHDLDQTSDEWIMGKTTYYKLSFTNADENYYIYADRDTMNFSWNGTAGGKGDALKNSSGTILINDQGLLRIKSICALDDEEGTTYREVDFTYKVLDSNGQEVKSGVTVTKSALDEGSVDATDYENPNSHHYDYTLEINIGAQPSSKINSEEQSMLNTYKEQPLDDSTYWDLSQYCQVVSYNSSTGKYTPYRWQSSSNAGHSTTSGSQYTSNCYMICHPGKYKIPGVFGNAISMGSNINSTLKGYNKGSSYALGKQGWGFPTCAKYWINDWSDALIYNGTWSSYTIDSTPVVIWSTADGVIKDNTVTGSVSSSGSYITFEVDKDHFQPANAVIGFIRKGNANTIIWSWHIWITPHATAGLKDQTGAFTADVNPLNDTKTEATYLKRPLGYIQLSTLSYAEREYKLVLTQNESGKRDTIILRQDKHEFPRQTCTYYQWGRKDPFPANINKETGHMYIDDTYELTQCSAGDEEGLNIWRNSLYPNYSVSGKDKTYFWAVEQPYLFYTKYTDQDGYTTNRIPDFVSGVTYDAGYTSVNHYDVWGNTTNYSSFKSSDGSEDFKTEFGGNFSGDFGKTSRKTYYDPCPPGFRVPASLEMPAVTYDGHGQGTDFAYYYMMGDSENPTNIADEQTLYQQAINTPVSDHIGFINKGGYEFYTSKMTDKGKKAEGLTWILPAMGEYSTDYVLNGVGSEAYYWTSSRWALGNQAVNHRCFGFQVKYRDEKTSVYPGYANTEFYGRPIMPIFDTTYPVYY